MQVGLHTRASRLACALALCLVLVPAPVLAAPLDTTPEAESQTVSVSIDQPTPSITSQGVMRVAVNVTLTAPAEYLEVRLRLRQPSGKLVYQKTEVRADAVAGQHIVDYEFDIGGLELEQGRYPLEVRVLATGSTPTNATGRLLVVDPDADILPVAVVVRAVGVPAVTADGRLAVDPAHDTRLRDDLAFITQLALERREPLSLAIPPVLVEQFGRVAAGYETTAGVAVAPSQETPQRMERMLQALRSTIETGTVDLVDVPYALPDLERLDDLGAASDLALHWSRTDVANATVLHTDTRPTVAYLGPTLTAAGIASLEERGLSCVLASPDTLVSDDGTATPGCYRLEDEDVQVLVFDEEASRGAHLGADEFYDALFDRIGGGPAVIMIDIGTAEGDGTLAVANALQWAQEASWLRLVSLESLSSRTGARRAELDSANDSAGDAAYWGDIQEGRTSALAYAAAVGADDPDAAAVLRAALIGESALFGDSAADDIGYDGTAYARQAAEFVNGQFALIRLDTKDVTLSGTKGNVPLTLINDTGKTLHVTVRARSSTVLPGSPTQEIVAGPTQNFITVPIDLGNTLGDTLLVEVLAGDMRITETSVDVRASYMDRLATIGMVVLVLGGLLLFIRKRVSSLDAGTIVPDDRSRDDAAAGE